MHFLKILASIITILYLILIVVFYFLQTKLIFYPGKLQKDFNFNLEDNVEEVFLSTKDNEQINALFFTGSKDEVILYFHGNAGDLSGWQLIARDFTASGYNFLIIDYRGYGKSSGKISETGFYNDAGAAYTFLIEEKGFTPQNILIYGRSIGSGVAVDLAAKYSAKGLILEAPCSSLKKLGQEKFPFFFTSLYLKFQFDNIEKINSVTCPIVFLHGSNDTIIPPSHSETLFAKFSGKKKLIIIPEGGHNDLNTFKEYHALLVEILSDFF